MEQSKITALELHWQETIKSFLLKNITDIQAIYIFGSMAQHQMQKDSDIDIAILCKKRLDHYPLWEISQRLATQLNKDIDLIDFRNASLILQHEVIYHGALIFCQDKVSLDHFETVILSEYTHFNEARAPLLKDIQERGNIYG